MCKLYALICLDTFLTVKNEVLKLKLIAVTYPLESLNKCDKTRDYQNQSNHVALKLHLLLSKKWYNPSVLKNLVLIL